MIEDLKNLIGYVIYEISLCVLVIFIDCGFLRLLVCVLKVWFLSYKFCCCVSFWLVFFWSIFFFVLVLGVMCCCKNCKFV